MCDRLDELAENTIVVLATFTSAENLVSYVAKTDLDIPVLMDAHRDAYRAFGLGRGSVARVWGPKMVRRYLEIFASDGFTKPERATEDTLQLGGDFVIDSDGNLAYGFWSEGPDDRPTVDALIAATLAAAS